MKLLLTLALSVTLLILSNIPNYLLQRKMADFDNPTPTQLDQHQLTELSIINSSLPTIEAYNILTTFNQPITLSYTVDIEPYKALLTKFDVPQHLQQTVIQLAYEYNIKPTIAIGLFQIESLWTKHPNYLTTYSNRINKNGTFDLGLGQLNTRYLNYFENRYYNPELLNRLNYLVTDKFNVFDDIQNMQVSLAYLSYLQEYFDNDIHLALIAYNCGMGNVLRDTIPLHSIKYSIAIQQGYYNLNEVILNNYIY